MNACYWPPAGAIWKLSPSWSTDIKLGPGVSPIVLLVKPKFQRTWSKRLFSGCFGLLHALARELLFALISTCHHPPVPGSSKEKTPHLCGCITGQTRSRPKSSRPNNARREMLLPCAPPWINCRPINAWPSCCATMKTLITEHSRGHANQP